MERLVKALDRAREGTVLEGARSEPDAAGRFTYTRTRVMPARRGTLRRGRIVDALDDARMVDAYRLLRTRVLHRMKQNRWRTLGITSAGPREGKSLTAANLAVSIARDHRYSVLLVDADLRKPTQHKLFGMNAGGGLGDYLVNGAPVEDLLVNPGIDRLVVFPGNPRTQAHSEHIAGPRMKRLVSEVRKRYPERLVIFDLPPVLVGDDVLAVAPELDSLLLVANEGQTQNDELARTVELLDGHNILGVVLNRSTERTKSYGEYYYK